MNLCLKQSSPYSRSSMHSRAVKPRLFTYISSSSFYVLNFLFFLLSYSARDFLAFQCKKCEYRRKNPYPSPTACSLSRSNIFSDTQTIARKKVSEGEKNLCVEH